MSDQSECYVDMQEWLAEVDLSVWRKNQKTESMRRAFISKVAIGECPTEDLLQAVAKWLLTHPKQLAVFKFSESCIRYMNLRRALAERPDEITEKYIFKLFAGEWGQEASSVERTFRRWEAGELRVNKIEMSPPYRKQKILKEIPESKKSCDNCHYWHQQKCWLDPYDVHPTLPNHLCSEGVHLTE